MLTEARVQVLDVTKNDWEIGDRKGTSHKVQLLVKQSQKYSVHTAKYNPEKVQFEVGEEVDVTLEFKETKNGTTTEVIVD